MIIARPVATLTAEMTSSPSPLSFFSTRAAHAAQVMPPIDSSIFCTAEKPLPATDNADTFGT